MIIEFTIVTLKMEFNNSTLISLIFDIYCICQCSSEKKNNRETVTEIDTRQTDTGRNRERLILKNWRMCLWGLASLQPKVGWTGWKFRKG